MAASGILGLPVKSPTVTYAVGERPTIVSFTATRVVLDVGMSTNLTVTTSGGTAPLSFAYSGLPTGCSSANASTLTCTPTAAESSTVQVTVTDSVGVSVNATLGLTVNPPLLVSGLSTNRAVVTVGVPFNLSTNASGGGAGLSYGYSGLPADCLSVDFANVTCAPGSSGTFNITVVVTDVAGASGNASVRVLVNPPIFVTLSVTPSTITQGQNVTFHTVATGGTGPLNYSYVDLPTGCNSVNATEFNCTPTEIGTFTVQVHVTDVFGIENGAPNTLTVNSAPPTPSHTPSGPGGIPWWLWAVVVVVILAGLVGAVLLLRRRRSSAPALTETPGAPGATPPPPPPPSS